MHAKTFSFFTLIAFLSILFGSEVYSAQPNRAKAKRAAATIKKADEPSIRLVPIKATNKKVANLKKPIQKINKPIKAAISPLRKIGLKLVTPNMQNNRTTFLPVYLFSITGTRSEKTLSALPIGNQLLLVRLDDTLNFMDLLTTSKLYSLGDNQAYTPLTMTSVNLEKKFVLMKMINPQLKTEIFTWPKNPTSETIKYFGLNSVNEFISILNQFEKDFNEPTRKISSLNPNDASIVEEKLLIRAQKIVKDFTSSTETLKIGKMSLFSQPPGTRCQFKSPEVADSSLQMQITTAQAVDCSWIDDLEVSPQVRQSFELTSGILTIKDANSFSTAMQIQLAQELAAPAESQMLLLSKSVQFSSQSKCEKVFLSDKQLDVYFCTRNFKQIPRLADSLILFGGMRGPNYIYTMVRASGFNGEMNQQISNKILTTLGQNL